MCSLKHNYCKSFYFSNMKIENTFIIITESEYNLYTGYSSFIDCLCVQNVHVQVTDSVDAYFAKYPMALGHY